MVETTFTYLVRLRRDVPKVVRFIQRALDSPLMSALFDGPKFIPVRSSSSSYILHVTDINSTMTKLMSLGAELDGPIKHEIHAKVAAMRCVDGHVLGLYEPS